ncbi:Uncharacterised protein [Legionella pneumophila]|nr:Uncharacterised protein [Legionella pneumophila]
MRGDEINPCASGPIAVILLAFDLLRLWRKTPNPVSGIGCKMVSFPFLIKS